MTDGGYDLVMFDVDGCLIRSFLREGAPRSEYDVVELLPGRLERVAQLVAGHSAFALVTNQAGVAMGYQSVPQVHAKLGVVCSDLGWFGGRPVSVHVCFHHPHARLLAWREDPCPRRKPGGGMLLEAMRVHRARPERCVFVGDMTSDREAARAARVPYVDQAEFFGRAG